MEGGGEEDEGVSETEGKKATWALSMRVVPERISDEGGDGGRRERRCQADSE